MYEITLLASYFQNGGSQVLGEEVMICKLAVDKQNASAMLTLFVLVTTTIKLHKPQCFPSRLFIDEYNHVWHPHMKSLKKVKTNHFCITSWTPSKAR